MTMTLLAYLDPGLGSMVLQATIAGLLSGMFLVRSSWVRVRGWLLEPRGTRAER